MEFALADLYKCDLCAAEQNRMTRRTSQGPKSGSTAGLFVKWFPRGEKVVKKFLTWKDGADNG